MILNITEKEAELIYRMLGGKRSGETEGNIGEDISSDVGDSILVPPGSGIDVIGGISIEDTPTVDSLMAKVVEKRQNADRRVLAKLDKVIEELKDSGFAEQEVTALKFIKADVATHNEKKYAGLKKKKKLNE